MGAPALFLSAGEASGDAYGAGLITALRSRFPDLTCFGLGGDAMAASGCELVVPSREVAVVGLLEVVRHLPLIRARFHRLLRAVEARRPAAAVLIDFPDFNLRLARALHDRGIPVIYLVSPQLWAWRQGRIKQVQKYVRKMIVIFPFEAELYRRHNVDAVYIGHPLMDLPAPRITRDEFAAHFGLDPEKPWVALLPGSRRQEVVRHLPAMLAAAAALGKRFQFVIPVASTLDRGWVKGQLPAEVGPEVELVEDTRAALLHSRAAVVASGTATVEAALIGTPFIVVYKVASLTYALGRRLVRLEHYAMPNLIAGRTVVTELIQSRMTAANIVQELRPLLDEGPTRDAVVKGLAEVRARLHPFAMPALERAADEVANVVKAIPM